MAVRWNKVRYAVLRVASTGLMAAFFIHILGNRW